MMKKFTGTREAFATALEELADSRKPVVFISPDSLKAMRAVAFAEKYPTKYIEVGIAEQGAVDLAGGMASCGIVPYVGTYAGFLTMRACEQIRTFVAYTNMDVKFIGINGGLIGGEREGTTHQFYEDIGILSSIPNVTIFTPCDPGQTYWAVKQAYETPGPVYIRAASGREADVLDRELPFAKEGIRAIREYGNEAVLFSSGFVLDRAIGIADLLHEQGIDITVCDINIINAKDPSAVIEKIKTSENIFTFEDHNIHGGLGSYICGLVCEHAPRKVTRIGMDSFGESGKAKELADHYGLGVEQVSKLIASSITL